VTFAPLEELQMRKFLRFSGYAMVMFILLCRHSAAQSDTPVRIEFDKKSERIDLVTGKELPAYSKVQRGSIRFHLGRLDSPDEFVSFFHDGVRSTQIKNLKMMKKVQPKFAVWRLRYTSGSKNTPRIHHLAVSFVPLSLSTGEPLEKVYVKLNDLALIEW